MYIHMYIYIYHTVYTYLWTHWNQSEKPSTLRCLWNPTWAALNGFVNNWFGVTWEEQKSEGCLKAPKAAQCISKEFSGGPEREFISNVIHCFHACLNRYFHKCVGIPTARNPNLVTGDLCQASSCNTKKTFLATTGTLESWNVCVKNKICNSNGYQPRFKNQVLGWVW